MNPVQQAEKTMPARRPPPCHPTHTGHAQPARQVKRRLLRVGRASARLRMSSKTLKKYARLGYIHAYRRGKRWTYYEVNELYYQRFLMIGQVARIIRAPYFDLRKWVLRKMPSRLWGRRGNHILISIADGHSLIYGKYGLELWR